MMVKHRPVHMNPGVFQINRLPPRAYFLPPQTLLLSGSWDFHLTDSPLAPAPDTDDRKAWNRITVPGHWELQGYGKPQYTNFDYPFPTDPPNVPSINPTGYYETDFTVPEQWEQEGSWNLRLRFEGVDSAFHVFVNGNEVGYNQGRTNAAEFSIDHLVEGASGDVNRLRVVVYKWSDGSYIEDQDMWWLSGIYRDVFLLAFPKRAHIEDFFVRTNFDVDNENATLEVNVKPEYADDVSTDAVLNLKLFDSNGEEIASASSQLLSRQVKNRKRLIDVSKPRKWTAETPYLYKLVLSLSCDDQKLQEIEQQVGFRTVEVSGGQLRVNGTPVEIRGVNRHDHHPRFGRAVPFHFIKHDLITMKRHNVNALRCSHYPNDPRLLILANQLGLYVMDEADLECHGMGVNFARLPSADLAWRGAYVDRMQNLVHRDKNQPSVIMWSLGNESWYGENHQAMYEWSKEFDPTRPIHYENDHEFRASDVESYMYTGYDQLAELATRDGDDYKKPILLCEYLHAMGAGPGSAKEYMELFRKHRRLQGGYVWEWANHGLLRTSSKSNERYFAYGGDFGDEPNDGNFVMDGLCDSEHAPGPGLIELKYAYQPVALTARVSAHEPSHSVHIENLHDFADLDDFECVSTILSCDEHGQEVVRGNERRRLYGIGPGDSKAIITTNLSRLTSTAEYEETWLRVSIQQSASNAWAAAGHEIAKADFHLPQSQPATMLPPIKRLQNTKVETAARILTVSNPTTLFKFDKIYGEITEWSFMGQNLICPEAGPRLTFWRGPTDNDKGGQLGEWKSHRLHEMTHQIRSIRHELNKETGALDITVVSYIAPPVLPWGFQSTTTYTVHNDSTLQIHIKASPHGPAPATLPRIGLEMLLPADDLTRCQWFGLGPGQSYKDMKSMGQLGVWDRDLEAMMYLYDMPQENGNRTETRWVKVVNERGVGVRAVLEHGGGGSSHTGTPDHELGKERQQQRGFDFSISRYTAEELERAGHPYQLKRAGGVVFRIDEDHHGLGSAACGPDVMDRYQLKMREFEFTVSLEPVR